MARAARFFTRTSLLLSFLGVAIVGCGGSGNGTDAGSAPEASVDSAIDTSTDAAPECHGDLDCNDGLFCNGEEHCTAGRCVAGTPPACSDMIACTHDYCSEDRRACVHQVPDVDMDGHGDAACVDAGGVALGDDCDDTDANRFPGNAEVCDAAHHDEDCSQATHGHVDNDSDGFEDAACCNGTSCGDDCDDSNRSVNPSATEVCNHIDDNCNAMIDEGVGVAMYPDADRDGYGDSSMATTTQCGDTVGYAAQGGDCDDTRVDRNPGQLEVCDTVDNDCDTTVDENAGVVPWYVDADHDGYGDPHGATLTQCAPPTGSYSLAGTDCDDTTNTRSPRAPEVCNAIDDDCNGLADFAITPGDLEDDDHDGVADIDCGAPRGMDCNDRDASALPGAPEICNGRDDDCDMHVDEDATSATFHRDADMDGFGDPGTAVIGCFAPAGYVSDATDCDDTAAARHPGATEVCNASDDDCDRSVDESPAEASCAIPEAIAACTVGICHEVGCQPGFSDCTLAAGCETSTVADNLRCGGCSAACDPMFSECAASQCVPSGYSGVVGVSRGDDVGTAIATDGSTRVVGGTTNGADFGFGCGTAFDALGVAAVVSLRGSDGRCTQALQIDGSGDEVVTGVAIAGGNAYVVLTTTSATLSVGTTAVNAGTGMGGRDVVVAALDPSFAVLWARRFGGTFDDTLSAIASDGTDVWLVGSLRGPVTFDALALASATSTDLVAVSLSATTGSATHLVSVPTAGDDGAADLSMTATDVFVAGVLTGAGTFGTTPLMPMGSSDGVLWQIDRATATTVGGRVFGGTGADRLTSVATGVSSGLPIGVSGTFSGTMTLDSGMLTSAGGVDGFVAGVNASPYTVGWAVQVGGLADDVVTDLTAVGPDYVACGTIGGDATWTGALDAGVVSRGGTDAFLYPLDAAGGFNLGFASFGGPGADQALAIAGAMYDSWMAGSYSGNAMAPFASLPGVGGRDAFWVTTGLGF